MNIDIAISGFDDTEILRDCVESARPLGKVWYCDGAYRDFLDLDGQPWSTSPVKLAAVLIPEEAKRIITAPTAGPWRSEATKKSVFVRKISLFSDDYVMFLDTDERLEIHDIPRLKRLIKGKRWANVNIYRPDQGWAPCGWHLPRIVKLTRNLGFAEPRDYQIWDGDERIAFLDGEPVPEYMSNQHVIIPSDVIRIRHDKMLRPEARREQSNRYVRRRDGY